MKINPVTLIIIISFFYPILKGLLVGFSSYSAKRDLENVIGSVSFILAIYVGIKYIRNIFIGNENSIFNKIISHLPDNMAYYFQSKPIVIYLIVIPLAVYIIYKIIYTILLFISNITLYHLIDGIEKLVKNKNYVFRKIMGAVVQIPRAVCYILVVLLALNFASIFTTNSDFNRYLSNSNIYRYLCQQFVIPVTNSSVAKKLPQIIDDSVSIVVKQNNLEKLPNGKINDTSPGRTIVYYNGVTLDEGIKSNQQINNFAKNLTAGETDTISKSKKLYDWIGRNIDYDYNKANLVLNNNFNVQSGAIPTFESRKGICFDYACLYVAMARANNIKVRLVTGDGFNGVSWVSHAWNMVYIPETGKWINVDTTFSKGGNYFNSRIFDLDHKNAKIIGEW
ncbi:transglutaminase domain-containing protein [Clostridium pasteurianum DSM 525 = ATCC 6013]|uniref:Transglutaminase domain-containing protein n=1 Tax=Clostridium pasteurianum DSM 525 = ATCC 6013 TaxID=1262449 RepID=A0A0H3J9D1_CLOPA|nr:transglutaminase-like domain-containing protein [Clostridium pasteurianum]AJA47715.1 transglutaminase domain-containing protein [Clostridium pasteurianum DSM 525 = ATCC 6013]AJA51703.1 transglutaminase domain-containing protein [Clostridium pasteurianum DSM 525 = ATCC 6013]AOZ75015.1 transglutaminase [Clostridium pasteurianum DSM 525 = ATCC 6013]AOZ78810.1 transglutaminase [Clostridium pasteurianum]ELP59617.1 transglutaminase [Clostridium pasteurianum DSM 525 = ATCC 6013]